MPPQIPVSTPMEGRKWFKALFNVTKPFQRAPDFYITMALQKVPLFTPKELRSGRLRMDPDGIYFQYYRRSLFKRLSDKVKAMRTSGERFLYFYGTSGAGKSHVLAAFAASLVAEGERFVFLADCCHLAPEPISGIRPALYLASADDDEVVVEISKIVDRYSLQEFCRTIGYGKLVFIIDQVNALDSTADSNDKDTEEQKGLTRTILDKITRYHLNIHSASGDYWYGEGDRLRISGHQRLAAYRGLEQIETNDWWANEELGSKWGRLLQGHHRKEIESYTGMVPTVLAHIVAASSNSKAFSPVKMSTEIEDNSTINPISNTQDPISVFALWCEMIAQFVLYHTEKVKETVREEFFFRATECCVTETAADEMTWSLVDNRFMYVLEGIGYCSGGILARKIATNYLRTWSIKLLSGTTWYSALRSRLNPAVLGVLVEQMGLSWISVHVCELMKIDVSSDSCTFSDPDIPR